MSNSSLDKRFVADEMVGKLARLMRMLGFDTVYFKEISDRRLIEISLSEKRTILTRDTKLIQRVLVKDYVLIESDDPEIQLQELLQKLNISPDRAQFLTRCLDCNSLLVDIEKEEIKGKVWPYTYATHDKFKICPACGKIYWEGDHVRAMRKRLERLGIFESN
jgi:uncharacterized protein with PIN domain